MFACGLFLFICCASFAQPRLQPEAQANLQPQLDEIRTSLRELRLDLERNRNQNWIRDWIPLIATVLTALVAIYSLRSNLAMAERTLREKSREEERKAIREKIDEFYGPFILLRAKSRALYEGLFLPRRTQDERQKFAGPDGRYRTVLALVKGHRFNGADKVLLDQITDIGQQTAVLIQTKMGLVDEDAQEVLSQATVHFWVMHQLMQANLVGDEEFGKFVFPGDLDQRIQTKLAGLNKRLVELQGRA